MKGDALGPVAHRCIIPMPLQRHWNNASARHRPRCFAHRFEFHPSSRVRQRSQLLGDCLARANRPLICTLFREKMTIFCGKLTKKYLFCQVPTIKGLADAMCSKFGWVAPSQCRCSGNASVRHRLVCAGRAFLNSHLFAPS